MTDQDEELFDPEPGEKCAAEPLREAGAPADPYVTVVPRAQPPAEWFREPEGYRVAVDGAGDQEMADRQAREREAGD